MSRTTREYREGRAHNLESTKKMTTPKFGIFETFAARWTDHEAWVLIDGKWKEFEAPGEVLMNAVAMSEAEYVESFGTVPPLPANAFTRDFDKPAA